MKILLCVGTRPNFVKAASIVYAAKQFDDIEIEILHTGQHHSTTLSDVFFHDLQIPEPVENLGVADSDIFVIMNRFQKFLSGRKYDYIFIFGDVNSSLACSIVASKSGIPVCHIEAGLRSFDTRMPEETNRIIIDRLSDFLFTTEESANINLTNENLNRYYFVGNTMIDTLVHHWKRITSTPWRLDPGSYAVLTLHRNFNVDNSKKINFILDGICSNTPEGMKIIFPVHPRTQKLLYKREQIKKIIPIEAMSYLDFMNMVYHSAFVMTDSGGVQEETTYMKKICFTLRPNTERPVTTAIGTNVIIDERYDLIPDVLTFFDPKTRGTPKFWDGKTGERDRKSTV